VEYSLKMDRSGCWIAKYSKVL